MGHIKEPKGVDFIIESRLLTIAEELAISNHIKNYKLKISKPIAKPKHPIRKGNEQLV